MPGRSLGLGLLGSVVSLGLIAVPAEALTFADVDLTGGFNVRTDGSNGGLDVVTTDIMGTTATGDDVTATGTPNTSSSITTADGISLGTGTLTDGSGTTVSIFLQSMTTANALTNIGGFMQPLSNASALTQMGAGEFLIGTDQDDNNPSVTLRFRFSQASFVSFSNPISRGSLAGEDDLLTIQAGTGASGSGAADTANTWSLNGLNRNVSIVPTADDGTNVTAGTSTTLTNGVLSTTDTGANPNGISTDQTPRNAAIVAVGDTLDGAPGSGIRAVGDYTVSNGGATHTTTDLRGQSDDASTDADNITTANLFTWTFFQRDGGVSSATDIRNGLSRNQSWSISSSKAVDYVDLTFQHANPFENSTSNTDTANSPNGVALNLGAAVPFELETTLGLLVLGLLGGWRHYRRTQRGLVLDSPADA